MRAAGLLVAGCLSLATGCTGSPASGQGSSGAGGGSGGAGGMSSGSGLSSSSSNSGSGAGSSASVGSSSGAGGGAGGTLPKHALIGYWHNFNNPSGCAFPIAQVSADWDVIVVAFAENDPQSNGTVHFTPAGSDPQSPACAAIDPAALKADIKAKRAAGKIVALSLGGAEGNITLNTDADEANFVGSLTSILGEWGFDGIDIDLESGSGLIHGSPIQTRLVSAIKSINKNVGGNMYLSMAPEHPYVQGGVAAFSSIWGAYLPIIDALRDELDVLHVQLYNNGSVPTPNTAAYSNGKTYPEATVDNLVVSVTMLVEGFTTASNWHFNGLPASKVAFGLPSGASSSNSPVTSNLTIENAFHCLTKGTNCGQHVPSAMYPDFRGVMTWSINWDKHDGFPFSKELGGFLHGP